MPYLITIYNCIKFFNLIFFFYFTFSCKTSFGSTFFYDGNFKVWDFVIKKNGDRRALSLQRNNGCTSTRLFRDRLKDTNNWQIYFVFISIILAYLETRDVSAEKWRKLSSTARSLAFIAQLIIKHIRLNLNLNKIVLISKTCFMRLICLDFSKALHKWEINKACLKNMIFTLAQVTYQEKTQ